MTGRRPEELYLDLIKKTLAFTLWPEPPVPIEMFNYRRSPLKKALGTLLSRTLRFKQLQLVRQTPNTLEQREEGRCWPHYGETMIGLKRLDNLQDCVETVIRARVDGDLIETGVWRGGACILMRAVLAAYGVEERKVYVADSFEGLPRPDANKYPADEGDVHHTHEYLVTSQSQVENNFRKYGLLDDSVVFLKGWFKDTLPTAPIEKLAVMRLDGDMYGSTMEALTHLYPKLAVGGFCIIDDYALQGCRRAVDDFRAENDVREEMRVVDFTCRYWRKA